MKSICFFISLLCAIMAFGEDVKKDKIEVCGDKPNCVSSLETRDDYKIASLKNLTGSWPEIKVKIETIMKTMGTAQLNSESDNFCHFVVTTKLMRYKDDVYFWWSPENKELNFKSESRTGYWDLGANRKRLNTFISKWQDSPSF